MADNDTPARIYPELNLDNLAFIIYIDIMTDGGDHAEFDVYNDDFDTRTTAIDNDIRDIIYNVNHYDWLTYFASHENLQHRTATGDWHLFFRLDALLGISGDLDDSGQKLDWNDYDEQCYKLAQRVSTMMDHRGINHQFSGFGSA